MMLQHLHERAFTTHDWQHVLPSFRASQDFERIGLRKRGGNLLGPRLSASEACLHTYVLHTAIAEDGGRVNCVLAKRKNVPKDVYEGCLQIRMHVQCTHLPAPTCQAYILFDLEHYLLHRQAAVLPQAGNSAYLRTASRRSCLRCCEVRRNRPQTGAEKQRQDYCLVNNHVDSRCARSIWTAGERRRIREEGLM
jgi:hypothetical protein